MVHRSASSSHDLDSTDDDLPLYVSSSLSSSTKRKSSTKSIKPTANANTTPTLTDQQPSSTIIEKNHQELNNIKTNLLLTPSATANNFSDNDSIKTQCCGDGPDGGISSSGSATVNANNPIPQTTTITTDEKSRLKLTTKNESGMDKMEEDEEEENKLCNINKKLVKDDEEEDCVQQKSDNNKNEVPCSSIVATLLDILPASCVDEKSKEWLEEQLEPDLDPEKKDIMAQKTIVCSVPLERLSEIMDTLVSLRKIDLALALTDKSLSQQMLNKTLCLYCDRTFSSQTLYGKHLERVHQATEGRRLSARKTSTISSLLYPGCSHCNNGKTTSLLAEELPALFQHLIDIHFDKYFACKPCILRFPNKDSLQVHMDDQHKDLVLKKKSPKTNAYDKRKKRTLRRDSLLLPTTTDLSVDFTTPLSVLVELDQLPSQTDNDNSTADDSNFEEPSIRSSRRQQANRLALMKQSSNIRKKQILRNEETILSRLGITQNRSPRTRKSMKNNSADSFRAGTPLIKPVRTKSTRSSTANGATLTGMDNGEASSATTATAAPTTPATTPSTRSSSALTKAETLSGTFDEHFYESVNGNVRQNLCLHIDGKLDSSPAVAPSPISPVMAAPTVRSTLVTSPNLGENEIHEATAISAMTAFPTLLTAQQYGADPMPSGKIKKPITKNSWKWKWDCVKKYKYVNEGGKVVKKIKQPVAGRRDLSKLDMWTQLTMRTKHESVRKQEMQDTGIAKLMAVGEAAREERRRLIDQLNKILDSRILPQINLEQNDQRIVKLEPEIGVEDDVPAEIPSTTEPPTSPADDLPAMLQLSRKPASISNKTSEIVLSGEWARPRCYICYGCGGKFETVRLLEEHKATHHPYVLSTHYEIVGKELIDGNLFRHFYIPSTALQRHREYVRRSMPNNVVAQPAIEGAVDTKDNIVVEDSMDSVASYSISFSKSDSFDMDSNSRNSKVSRTSSRSIQTTNTTTTEDVISAGSGADAANSNSGAAAAESAVRKLCTKCNRSCKGMLDLYRHMLDCSGDYAWLLAKKRQNIKYRYFGSRKRKIHRPNNCNGRRIVRPKKKPSDRPSPREPQTPKPKPSDAESIQRMLENLPAKRACRQIFPNLAVKKRTTRKFVHHHATNLVRGGRKQILVKQTTTTTAANGNCKSTRSFKFITTTAATSSTSAALNKRKKLFDLKNTSTTSGPGSSNVVVRRTRSTIQLKSPVAGGDTVDTKNVKTVGDDLMKAIKRKTQRVVTKITNSFIRPNTQKRILRNVIVATDSTESTAKKASPTRDPKKRNAFIKRTFSFRKSKRTKNPTSKSGAEAITDLAKEEKDVEAIEEIVDKVAKVVDEKDAPVLDTEIVDKIVDKVEAVAEVVVAEKVATKKGQKTFKKLLKGLQKKCQLKSVDKKAVEVVIESEKVEEKIKEIPVTIVSEEVVADKPSEIIDQKPKQSNTSKRKGKLASPKKLLLPDAPIAAIEIPKIQILSIETPFLNIEIPPQDEPINLSIHSTKNEAVSLPLNLTVPAVEAQKVSPGLKRRTRKLTDCIAMLTGKLTEKLGVPFLENESTSILLSPGIRKSAEEINEIPVTNLNVEKGLHDDVIMEEKSIADTHDKSRKRRGKPSKLIMMSDQLNNVDFVNIDKILPTIPSAVLGIDKIQSNTIAPMVQQPADIVAEHKPENLSTKTIPSPPVTGNLKAFRKPNRKSDDIVRDSDCGPQDLSIKHTIESILLEKVEVAKSKKSRKSTKIDESSSSKIDSTINEVVRQSLMASIERDLLNKTTEQITEKLKESDKMPTDKNYVINDTRFKAANFDISKPAEIQSPEVTSFESNLVQTPKKGHKFLIKDIMSDDPSHQNKIDILPVVTSNLTDPITSHETPKKSKQTPTKTNKKASVVRKLAEDVSENQVNEKIIQVDSNLLEPANVEPAKIIAIPLEKEEKLNNIISPEKILNTIDSPVVVEVDLTTTKNDTECLTGDLAETITKEPDNIIADKKNENKSKTKLKPVKYNEKDRRLSICENPFESSDEELLPWDPEVGFVKRKDDKVIKNDEVGEKQTIKVNKNKKSAKSNENTLLDDSVTSEEIVVAAKESIKSIEVVESVKETEITEAPLKATPRRKQQTKKSNLTELKTDEIAEQETKVVNKRGKKGQIEAVNSTVESSAKKNKKKQSDEEQKIDENKPSEDSTSVIPYSLEAVDKKSSSKKKSKSDDDKDKVSEDVESASVILKDYDNFNKESPNEKMKKKSPDEKTPISVKDLDSPEAVDRPAKNNKRKSKSDVLDKVEADLKPAAESTPVIQKDLDSPEAVDRPTKKNIKKSKSDWKKTDEPTSESTSVILKDSDSPEAVDKESPTKKNKKNLKSDVENKVAAGPKPSDESTPVDSLEKESPTKKNKKKTKFDVEDKVAAEPKPSDESMPVDSLKKESPSKKMKKKSKSDGEKTEAGDKSTPVSLKDLNSVDKELSSKKKKKSQGKDKVQEESKPTDESTILKDSSESVDKELPTKKKSDGEDKLEPRDESILKDSAEKESPTKKNKNKSKSDGADKVDEDARDESIILKNSLEKESPTKKSKKKQLKSDVAEKTEEDLKPTDESVILKDFDPLEKESPTKKSKKKQCDVPEKTEEEPKSSEDPKSNAAEPPKPRKKRKNELSKIIADQLLESFKEVDESRIEQLKILHDLSIKSGNTELFLPITQPPKRRTAINISSNALIDLDTSFEDLDENEDVIFAEKTTRAGRRKLDQPAKAKEVEQLNGKRTKSKEPKKGRKSNVKLNDGHVSDTETTAQPKPKMINKRRQTTVEFTGLEDIKKRNKSLKIPFVPLIDVLAKGNKQLAKIDCTMESKSKPNVPENDNSISSGLSVLAKGNKQLTQIDPPIESKSKPNVPENDTSISSALIVLGNKQLTKIDTPIESKSKPNVPENVTTISLGLSTSSPSSLTSKSSKKAHLTKKDKKSVALDQEKSVANVNDLVAQIINDFTTSTIESRNNSPVVFGDIADKTKPSANVLANKKNILNGDKLDKSLPQISAPPLKLPINKTIQNIRNLDKLSSIKSPMRAPFMSPRWEFDEKSDSQKPTEAEPNLPNPWTFKTKDESKSLFQNVKEKTKKLFGKISKRKSKNSLLKKQMTNVAAANAAAPVKRPLLRPSILSATNLFGNVEPAPTIVSLSKNSLTNLETIFAGTVDSSENESISKIFQSDLFVQKTPTTKLRTSRAMSVSGVTPLFSNKTTPKKRDRSTELVTPTTTTNSTTQLFCDKPTIISPACDKSAQLIPAPKKCVDKFDFIKNNIELEYDKLQKTAVAEQSKKNSNKKSPNDQNSAQQIISKTLKVNLKNLNVTADEKEKYLKCDKNVDVNVENIPLSNILQSPVKEQLKNDEVVVQRLVENVTKKLPKRRKIGSKRKISLDRPTTETKIDLNEARIETNTPKLTEPNIPLIATQPTSTMLLPNYDSSQDTILSEIVNKIRENVANTESDEDLCLAEIAKSLNNKILNSDEFSNDATDAPKVVELSESFVSKSDFTQLVQKLNENFETPKDDLIDQDENTNTDLIDMDLEDDVSVYTSFSIDTATTTPGRGGKRKRRYRRSILLKSNRKSKRAEEFLSPSEGHFCTICSKMFRTPGGLATHKTTLTHISKLSEQEFLNSKQQTPEPEANADEPSDNKTEESRKPIAASPISPARIPSLQQSPAQQQSVVSPARSLPLSYPQQSGIEPISSPEQVDYDYNQPSTNRSSAMAMSQEQRFFYECCSMLRSTTTANDQSAAQNKYYPAGNREMLQSYPSNHQLHEQPSVKPVTPKSNEQYSYVVPEGSKHSNGIPKIDLNQFSDISSDSNPAYSCPQIPSSSETQNNFQQLDQPKSSFASIYSSTTLLAAKPNLSSSKRSPSVAARKITKPTQSDELYSDDVSESDQYVQTILERANIVKKATLATLRESKNKFDLSKQNDKSVSSTTPPAVAASDSDGMEVKSYMQPSPLHSNSSQSSTLSKPRTKAAMKGYENFKVSIPTNGIDLQQALNHSPHSIGGGGSVGRGDSAGVAASCKLAALADIALGNDVPHAVGLMRSISQPGETSTIESSKSNLADDDDVFTPKNKSELAETAVVAKPSAAKQKSAGNKLGFNQRKKKQTLPKNGQPSKPIEDIPKLPKDVYEFEDSRDSVDAPIVPLSQARPKTAANDSKEELDLMPPTDLEDSQMSSYSDRDDFNYDSISESSEASDDDDDDDDDGAASAYTKRSTKSINNLQKKCLIMGRIFKSAKKPEAVVVAKERHVKKEQPKEAKKPIPKQELDKLFDSLRGAAQKNAKNAAEEIVQQKKTEGRKSDKVAKDEIVKRKQSRDSSRQSRKSREIANLEAEWNMSMDQIIDLIGVNHRKPQRRCAANKQNKLVETWSSDEYEEFHSTKDIIKLVEEAEKKANQSRIRNVKNRKDEPTTNGPDVETEAKAEDSKADQSVDPVAKVDQSSKSKPPPDTTRAEDAKDKKKKCSIESNAKHKNPLKPQLSAEKPIKKTATFAGVTETDDSNLESEYSQNIQRGRIKNRRSTIAFKEDETKPTKLSNRRRGREKSTKSVEKQPSTDATPPPKTTQHAQIQAAEPKPMARRKRIASEMLYYWSSSSDEEFGRIKPRDNDDDDDHDDHLEQHGWIVGDSHKKLVTLLAHAKGKKIEDCGVKEAIHKKK